MKFETVITYDGEPITLFFFRPDISEPIVIRGYDQQSHPWATLTRVFANHPLQTDEVILDTNNIPGIDKVLEDKKLVEMTGRSANGEFCDYPIARVLVTLV